MSYIQQFFTSRDNNANAETFVGQEGRLWWDPVTNQIYSSDGSTPGGIPLAGGGGGNGTPGGSNSQVQFNQAGNFGGSANLTFNSANGALTAVSFVGNGAPLTNITGANVTGTVADAGHATVADSANAVAGGNVTGNVANAVHAYFADAANSVAGGNVSGAVANATYATTAGSTTQLVNGSYSLVLNSNGTMAVPGNLINTSSSPVGFWSTDTVTSYWRSPTGGGAGLPFQSTVAMANTGVTLTFLSGTGGFFTAKSWRFGFDGNLTFPDATVQTTAFTGTATSATTAGTVTTNAQPNITSVGTLTSVTSTGNISTTGNVTGAYILGNGSQLTGIVSSYGNSNVAANLAAFGSNPISTTGNITGGNIIGTHVGNLTGTTASLSGNVTGGNVLSNGQLSAAGNITGGNLALGGSITTPGNIGASYVNGSYYTGTWSTNFVALGNISTTGNVIGGNVLTTGVMSSTGNAIHGNISVAGTISATGATNSTAFAVGNSAVSNVALGMFPTAGTPGEYAIRDYSNVVTNMYFDVGIGGSAGGNFVFRGTNSFTTYAKIDSTGLNMQSLAIQGQTPYMSKTAWNSALNTVITVDALQFRVNSGAGIFPQVQAVSGSVNLAWTAVASLSGTAIAQAGSTGSIISTWSSLYTNHGMDAAGDTIVVTLQDKGNSKIYRITFVRSDNGSTTGYNIIAERIL